MQSTPQRLSFRRPAGVKYAALRPLSQQDGEVGQIAVLPLGFGEQVSRPRHLRFARDPGVRLPERIARHAAILVLPAELVFVRHILFLGDLFQLGKTGLEVSLKEFVAVGVGYRFFGTSERSLRVPGGQNFSIEGDKLHLVEFGLRFNF